MFYTVDEVMSFIEENDVKFIRLAFCDLFGKQKNISILTRELQHAFSSGIAIDASAIEGFGDEKNSELFLVPDINTLSVLPWRPSHGRVVRFFCNIKKADGTIFEYDSREILKTAIKKMESLGINCNFGAECEFYLFKTDAEGNPTDIPFDNAGYMDIAPEDKGENVRREICFTLEEMGILPERSHHEGGPGQNEIDFKYSDALTSADNVITFRAVVKTIAARNGLYATFTPKPIANKPGNGFHINMSLYKTFESNPDKSYMNSFMAGIMKHIKDITILLNPTEESYTRLGEHKAPRYVSWSSQNRSQLIRIPSEEGEYKRIELRSPDSMSNPYIAYAALIYAGLDGVENYLTLPDPININLFSADEAITDNLDKLPKNLEEAFLKAEASMLVSTNFPKDIIEIYRKHCEKLIH